MAINNKIWKVFIVFYLVVAGHKISFAGDEYYYAGKLKDSDLTIIEKYAEIIKQIDQRTILIKGEPEKVSQLPQYGIPIKWLNEYEIIIATNPEIPNIPAISRASSATTILSVLPAVGTPEDKLYIQGILNSLTKTELQGFIQDLQNFQTRYYQSVKCLQARDYLVQKFQSYGLQVDTQAFTFGYNTYYNVVATLAGKTAPPEKVYIIGAHYDSISDQPYSSAPGADDNGSGVSAVLLAAKYLSQHQFNYTIKFICFGAEEPGLVGSSNYAKQQYYAGTQILAMINMDMIGYWTNGVKYDLNIIANTKSEWLAKYLETVNNIYVRMEIDRTINDMAWWSDHSPFWAYNFSALVAIEAYDWGSPDFNPYYHSPNDTLDKLDLDFSLQNAKVCIATLCELADLYRPPSDFVLFEPDGYNDLVEKGNSYTLYWSTGINTTLDFYFAKERFSPERTYIGSADGMVKSFTWTTINSPPGQYYLCAIRSDNGAEEWSSGIITVLSPVFEKYYVYPNPFRLTTTDRQLTFVGLTPNTKIEIYNLVGELVARGYARDQYKWSWNGVSYEGYEVSSGIYVYILRDTVTGNTATGKFVIVK